MEQLDERWQRNHRELAAALGETQKVAPIGGHYVRNDEPVFVASVIEDVMQSPGSD
ncbi:hypothetical protein [Kribbella sp. VKM Ac-2571]|uniref:hypothetical protein n=1 Tax=Kribbella sp. VKM Ac-2571 TaxID=2512222 RepID=UPI00141522A5|nr:hypothetical protein [Kribbella sp. VKM Ac-2571]